MGVGGHGHADRVRCDVTRFHALFHHALTAHTVARIVFPAARNIIEKDIGNEWFPIIFPGMETIL